MTIISTKETEHRRWICYGTINGYDASFEHSSQSASIYEMSRYLDNRNVNSYEVKWMTPVSYQEYIKEEADVKRTILDRKIFD